MFLVRLCLDEPEYNWNFKRGDKECLEEIFEKIIVKNYMKLMKDIKPRKYSLQRKPSWGISKSDHGKSKQLEYKSVIFKGATTR